MRRLPLDTSSFRQIRESGDVYVDKTPWIHRLLTGGRCYFLSRPRRFGKSLTINTLKELFRGNRRLFEDLYIYDKWDFREHPVLIFDFNEISHENAEELRKALQERLEKYASLYGVESPEETLRGKFEALLSRLYRKFKAPVVVLIDEYDKPILDHLGLGRERLEIARENREVLKNFFGVLKGAGVVDELRFVFVTGVSYFSKVSIFSEWNNLVDLTLDEDFADFLGYTEEEILQNFPEHLEAFCQKRGFSSQEECLSEIRYWYNGYRFSPWRDLRVYNPISVMYALSKGRFQNFWFKTGTPTFLVNWLKEKPWRIPELEYFRVSENFLQAYDLENLTPEAVMYQAGYLTIHEVKDRTLVLSYPNREVRESFQEVLLQGFSGGETTPRILADELGEALRRLDLEAAREILDEILSYIPHTLYDRADERFFHTVFYLALALSGYRAESEVLSHRGRLDMAVRYEGENRVFVFEFKAGESAEEALRQIEEKGYAERYRAQGLEVVPVGVSFDPRARRVTEIHGGK